MIWGVQVKDYQSWAISLVTTFESVLGKQYFGKPEKDAWMAVIGSVSSIMLDSYASAKAGKTGYLDISFGGKSFKKYWCVLNDTKLGIYRDKKVRRTSALWLDNGTNVLYLAISRASGIRAARNAFSGRRRFGCDYTAHSALH